jgi:hypothetical protein
MAKISKESAQNAKDQARREKQRVLGQAKKNLSTKDKQDIASYNAIIEAADTIINEED